jgi:hypothetical protein
MAEFIEHNGQKYPVDLDRQERKSFGSGAPPPPPQDKTQDDLEREAMDRAPRDAPGAPGAEVPQAPRDAPGAPGAEVPQAPQQEAVRPADQFGTPPRPADPEGTTGQGAGQGGQDMSALLNAMKEMQIELVAIRSSLENGIQITG